MSYRRFYPSEQQVAERWATTAESPCAWTVGNAVGQGEAQSVFVTSDTSLRAVAKPDERAGTPRAAHEKIASDLAFHLGLPIPPVTLWTDPTSGSRYAVSLFAFPQALTWDQAAPVRTAEFLAKVAPALAACYVFHNWIGDQDHHGHGGNLLVDGGSDPDSPGLAAIDHAFAMTYSWTQCPPPYSPIQNYYVPLSELPKSTLRETVSEVQQLPEDIVRQIVSRVPDVYLSSERGRLIVDCLLHRRSELTDLGS